MRILWTLFKIILGLAIAIPVGIFLLVATVGVVGTFVRFAIIALKLACVGFVGLGAFKLWKHLFGSSPAPRVHQPMQLPPSDPYYDAAMRELDAELGGRSR